MTTGKVTGIIANLVMVEVNGPVAQNEICYLVLGELKLMAEVIKIVGSTTYVQVFDSTRGVQTGTNVEFSGDLLEVELGPGILSKNYDGLQNDLNKLDGIFLQRGVSSSPLDADKKWNFKPIAKSGDTVEAASWLGEVGENRLPHKIMVPFKMEGSYTVKEVKPEDEYQIYDTIAVITDNNGTDHNITMSQKWPVKLAIKAYNNKPRPSKLLETGVRVIDSLNPMLEGGTGFIPGPFGCGKTVLQHALSKQADADVVIVAACGERANEVVEIFWEFPTLVDYRTGRKLMERTTIIANTSNMPVAAREASVYTAMTLGEYYRAMGLRVLLLADSTSRWAQALREMSNRLEDLPGPDAFPMDLSAIIANFYARAGIVELNNGKPGSITFIGTVSPAGGNLKEPVTESTKKATRCFYALSQQRADSKRYPAIDPGLSYSKYNEYPEFQEFMKSQELESWVDNANLMTNYLQRGKEASDQINILGDDGVPVGYHVHHWRAELIDFVVLQQDAFDQIDQMCPLKRQKYMVEKVLDICSAEFDFNHFEKVGELFKKLINAMKQMNYSEYLSEDFRKYEGEVDILVSEFQGSTLTQASV
ncbi:MAG: V-type ATP synthase subunit A [Crocinitomicaceae bacterium]|nr:V-type ATP synthase subunit A [Crocinitomicaceae bacterium]|tara:strand:+ start:3950 stop:5725 length:1776 start_codon:yes stop_codon:yes gene_type:complete